MPERTDRLALIDLETTGTSPATDRITEIGLVLMDAGEVTQCWSSLVNPGQPVAPEIQWLTGLSNEQLARAPVFSEVWPHLAPLLHQRILVAHNARFDHGFLKAEWRRLGERHFTEVLCAPFASFIFACSGARTRCHQPAPWAGASRSRPGPYPRRGLHAHAAPQRPRGCLAASRLCTNPQ